MISHSQNVFHLREDVGTCMGNLRDLPMFDDIQSFYLGAMLNAKTLKSKTDTEDGDKIFVSYRPKIFDEPNIIGVVR